MSALGCSSSRRRAVWSLAPVCAGSEVLRPRRRFLRHHKERGGGVAARAARLGVLGSRSFRRVFAAIAEPRVASRRVASLRPPDAGGSLTGVDIMPATRSHVWQALSVFQRRATSPHSPPTLKLLPRPPSYAPHTPPPEPPPTSRSSPPPAAPQGSPPAGCPCVIGGVGRSGGGSWLVAGAGWRGGGSWLMAGAGRRGGGSWLVAGAGW